MMGFHDYYNVEAWSQMFSDEKFPEALPMPRFIIDPPRPPPLIDNDGAVNSS